MSRIRKNSFGLTAAIGLMCGFLAVAIQPAVSAPAASVAAQIKSLQKQVQSLNAQVATLKRTKADASDVAEVANGVLVATDSVQSVSRAAANLQIALTALQSSVSGVTKVMDAKANGSDVALKADKDVVQALVLKVSALCAAQPSVCTAPAP